MTRRSVNLLQFWLTLVCFSIPGLAFGCAGYLRFTTGFFTASDVDWHSYAAWLATVTVVWSVVVEHLRLNRVETLATLQTEIKTTAKATAYTVVVLLALVFFYRQTTFFRVFAVAGCALMFVLTLATLHLFRGAIVLFKRSRNGRLRIAILGADERAAAVAKHLSRDPLVQCEVACFVALPNQSPAPVPGPVLEWGQLDQVVDCFHCREILIAIPSSRFADLQGLLERLQHLKVPARVLVDLGEGIFVPDRLFNFCGLTLLDVRPCPVDTVAYAVAKRTFDVAFSLLAIFLTAPLMLIIAAAIKLTSAGLVLFVQERVGLNGTLFRMYKFRTMRTGDPMESATRWTFQDDPRRTKLGSFLRRTSLDELPQFFNVLKGDMSVVGPRPERPYFVEKFQQKMENYHYRHTLKVGITGWAQVNGYRGNTSIPERIQYDLYYMKNWSLLFDLKILLLTVFNGLVSRNAY